MGWRTQPQTAQKSRLAKEQSEVDIESTRLSLQEQIVQIYVQILYQTEAVRVNREILANTRIQADRAKAMYEVGNMSRADYAQMEAQVSQEEYNVTNAETQLASFKLQLKQLLEIVDSPDFDVAVPEINPDNVLAILPTPADVYDMALNTRPELRYYRLGIESAEMDIDIAKRGYYPTLGMSAGINTSNMSGLDKSFGTQLKTNLNNNIGLSISIPIFDQKQNKTNVATRALPVNRRKSSSNLKKSNCVPTSRLTGSTPSTPSSNSATPQPRSKACAQATTSCPSNSQSA